VIGQIGAQAEALKRQARQAVRYRAVAADLRKAEAMLCHLRWDAAQSEVAAAAQAKDQSVRLVAEATGAQAEASTRQTNAAVTLPQLREAAAVAAAGLQRLIIARETLDREETRARERIGELDRRIAQLGQDLARERKLAVDAEGALRRLAEEEATLTAESIAAGERGEGAGERVATAEAALAADEKAFSELTRALADLSARRNQLERAASEHSIRLARLDSQIAEVDTELRSIEAQGAGPDIEAMAAAAEAAQTAVADAEAGALRAEASHSAARQGLDAARRPLEEAERRLHRLETEARTLAKLTGQAEQQLWPSALDLLNVEKGLETALGAALGDDLDAPIDPAAPMRWAGAEIDPSDASLPFGAEPLGRHVTAPPELARRLAQVGVVERADGPRLASVLKPGQRLVSREGDLWRWDGFAAAAHAPTAAARRLAQRNRLGDVERELAMVRAEVEVKRAAAAAAEEEVAAASAAEGEARVRRREAQSAADSVRDRHAAAERESGRVTARMSALTEAKLRLATSREEAAAMKGDAVEALAELPPAVEIEGELNEVRGRVTAKRAALAEARGEAQALAREAELRKRRLEAVVTERRQWEERRDGAGGQTETLESRLADTTAEREALNDAPEVFAEKRGALIEEIERAETTRRAASDELASAEKLSTEADRAARSALEAMAGAREAAARAEERFEAAKRRLTDIAHEIQELLDAAPDAVAALAGVEPGATLPSVSDVENDLEKLRRDRERLGAVNLRAEEELREVEAQFTTLTGERDDLTEAIKRLRTGIQSLNREARERLLASFEVVNKHFQELFTGLFGGGTAELQLVESDDPLEAGLDILAKPPGKKPQTLSLLSGGEQALTAMALIFAVFLTNPAPICVLDEVDAPLDDHNVERFCDLLGRMTEMTDTRFVIITHNPITMARMNRLFGVTMAERGVSQLVSVDLETAARFREAG
jgi:chromosome segregation protein